jgi:hypothetical protein
MRVSSRNHQDAESEATMRKVELKLEPVKVQITQEEILADLRYPAPVKAGKRKGEEGR